MMMMMMEDSNQRRNSSGSGLFSSSEDVSFSSNGSHGSSNGSEDPLATEEPTLRPLEEPLVLADNGGAVVVSTTTSVDIIEEEPPSYQPRTTSRVGQSCKFALVGLALCLAGVGLLTHYEGSAVRVEVYYETAFQKVHEFSSTSNGGDTFYPLQHFVGTLGTRATDNNYNNATTNSNPLQDPTFGVTYEKGVKLNRIARMYQWVESQDLNDEGDYEYQAEWNEFWQDSDDFLEQNHPLNPSDGMPYKTELWQADPIVLRVNREDNNNKEFTLSAPLIKALTFYEPLASNENPLDVNTIPNATLRERASISTDDSQQTLYLQAAEHYSQGRDPSQDPKVGDYQIQYRGVAADQTISVIAVLQQDGESDVLQPYRGLYGKQLVLVAQGRYTAREMLEQAQAADPDQLHLGIVRAVVALLLYMGLFILAQPASVLEDRWPAIQDVVGRGFHWPTAAVRLVPVAILVTCTVTSLCWCGHHPWRSVAYWMLQGAVIYLVGVELEWWGPNASANTKPAAVAAAKHDANYTLVVDQQEDGPEMMTELNEV
mmetsp:Transcript_14918/g.33860  ORF Transcript_14918/g.33860 Transcript_14918/m.33860 type:complete len:543 (+) Transcript_14918:2152-3780(+)